jgi:hypothetical protein
MMARTAHRQFLRFFRHLPKDNSFVAATAYEGKRERAGAHGPSSNSLLLILLLCLLLQGEALLLCNRLTIGFGDEEGLC